MESKKNLRRETVTGSLLPPKWRLPVCRTYMACDTACPFAQFHLPTNNVYSPDSYIPVCHSFAHLSLKYLSDVHERETSVRDLQARRAHECSVSKPFPSRMKVFAGLLCMIGCALAISTPSSQGIMSNRLAMASANTMRLRGGFGRSKAQTEAKVVSNTNPLVREDEVDWKLKLSYQASLVGTVVKAVVSPMGLLAAAAYGAFRALQE
eukprot:762163-Hanusia_phi.AAC.2